MLTLRHKLKFLSHPLKSQIPVYGQAQQKMELIQEKSQARGDSCQTYSIKFNNHWGTHVDCPAHFFPDGKNVCDYEAEFWHFEHPQIIELDLGSGELVTFEMIASKISKETDLLLLKSGWSQKRDRLEYSLENPGIDPDCGLALRKKFPSLRMIGFDWISISSYQKREAGRQAHRNFLDPKGEGKPILILEDMDLSDDLAELKQIFVIPLRVEGIDSAPCTVLGSFYD